MDVSKALLIAAAALSLPAVARDTDPCEEVSTALKNANEHEALADYWLAVAKCRNCDHCDDSACERAAKADLRDALKAAQDMYAARQAVCAALGGGAYDPQIDPTQFSSTIDNPYWTFLPGVTYVFEGQTADGTEHNEVTALATTVNVGGFDARPVHDTVDIGGVRVEDTIDYYAKSPTGDIWYVGEISQEFVDGFLDNIDGSWRTGHDGAKPGVAMFAAPQLGAFYRQEYLQNEAEDVAKVLAIDETVTIGLGTFEHCIKTEERTALEPDADELKYYAPGVGLILDLHLQTGERLELIDIH
jgi:hypothetical protein